MTEPKTRKTEASASDFLNAIANQQVREDCLTVAAIMEAATRDAPKMWGSAIVGFGTRRTVYANGKEADWMMMGFSPRKQAITLYGVLSAADEGVLAKLGTHSCGKGCLYIKRLSDIHMPTLTKLIKTSVKRKSVKTT